MKHENVPGVTTFWLVFDLLKKGKGISAYARWFETQDEAIEDTDSKNRRRKDTLGPYAVILDDLCILPSNIFWMSFDLSNGSKGGRHYGWWYLTKQETKAHIKDQRKNINNARLTRPYMVRFVNGFPLALFKYLVRGLDKGAVIDRLKMVPKEDLVKIIMQELERLRS